MARLTSSSYVKIGLIVLLALMLFGVAGFGSCSIWSGNPFWSYSWNGQGHRGGAEVDAAGINNLDIDWAAGSVTVSVHSDNEKIILTETASNGLTKNQEMRWDVSGDTLKVDYGNWTSCVSLASKHLEVSLPVSMAMGMGTLDIDGASGSYDVTGIVCDTFKASLASGSLNANDMGIGDLKVETASGQAYVKGEIANNVKLDTASGKVDIVCEKITPASLDADIASGTVTVSIPGDVGFSAKIDKLSGNFTSDFETTMSGDNAFSYKGGGMSVDIDMASGNFNLKKS